MAQDIRQPPVLVGNLDHDVLASLKDHIAVLDRSATIIAVNGAWVRFAVENGSPPWTAVGPGVNYLEICRQASKESDGVTRKALAGITSVLNGSTEEFALEYPCHSPSTPRWFLMSVTSLKRRDGGAVVSHRDITELKQAAVHEYQQTDAAQRRSLEELTDFVENGPLSLHWVGPDGTVLWANQAELDMLGYAREEYVGHNITDFHADRDGIDDILRRLQRNETLRNYEARFRHKDGSIRHVLINSNVLWRDGEFIHTRCFTPDVTERRRLEDALHRAHDKLEAQVRKRTTDLEAAIARLEAEISQRKRGEEALRRAHDELKVRVAQRTASLAAVNKQLEKEITERKQAEEALRANGTALLQSRRELRALAAELLRVQDEERRWFSCELHDDISQRLDMVAQDLGTLERRLSSPASKLIGTQLGTCRSNVKQLSTDIHRLAYQLHPSVLDDLGLEAAIQSLAEDLSKLKGLRIEIRTRNLPVKIPQDMALCLYRVTQESLWNVARHACTTAATVTVKGLPDGFFLRIQDHGIGFRPEEDPKARKRLGLISMRERVRLVGGNFSLRSKPGHGTRVRAWIPRETSLP